MGTCTINLYRNGRVERRTPMQSIDQNGSRGPMTEFDIKLMNEMLHDPAVKEVRVFNKQPPPGDQVPNDQAPPPDDQVRQMPKVIENFLLRKGMMLNLHGTLYKVTTSRTNGKATLKFVRFAKEEEGRNG